MAEGKEILIGSKRASIDDLRQTASKLEEVSSSATSDRSDVVEVANTIASAISGEASLSLPPNPDNQRKIVREILEGIEKSGRDCIDYSNVQHVRRLEISLDKMEQSVADEVRMRLAIHDSSELIKQAAGFLDRRDGLTVTGALSEAQRRGHDLNRHSVELFFKTGIKGLKLSEAWDLLEDANFKYPQILLQVNEKNQAKVFDELKLTAEDRVLVQKRLKKGNYDSQFIRRTKDEDDKAGGLSSGEKQWLISKLGDRLDSFHSLYGFELSDAEKELGKVPTNYFADSNVLRKEAVYNFIIKELGGDKNAVTSVRLAEKMAVATLETSVWNRSALSGNDELAEIIGLREYRVRRRVVGRNGGPEIHVNSIPGFGTSWIRLQTESGNIDTSQPIYSKDVDPSKITAGSHQAYGPAWLNRYQALRNLLTDRAPKPEFDNTFLQGAVPYFNTADRAPEGMKNGPLKLRTLWVAGVVDMALSHPSLGWGQKDLDNFRVAVSVQELSPQVGSFITPEQWAWVERATNFSNRLRKITMKSYTDSISLTGGSSKKR